VHLCHALALVGIWCRSRLLRCQLLRVCPRQLVDLDAQLYVLPLDAVTLDLLGAESHWAGDSNI